MNEPLQELASVQYRLRVRFMIVTTESIITGISTSTPTTVVKWSDRYDVTLLLRMLPV